MRYSKEIEPYNKFWGNCILNMFLSILLSKDPTYEPLIYLNAYEYSDTLNDIFHIDYTHEFYDYFRMNHFHFEPCTFMDKKDFLTELKNLLMKDDFYITLNVDLFDWNKAGAYYNKIHTPHFAFIIGFDEEEEIFYALEDDMSLNYDIREIPTENVIKAFFSDFKDNREDYRIITFKNNELKPYTLDMNQLVLNAKKVIQSIEELLKQENIIDKNILEDMSNVYYYGNEFAKISNRMVGNELLFEAMRNDEMLSETLINQLIARTNELSNDWQLVRSVFLKYCKSNRLSEVANVEKTMINHFIKEKEMWLTFIEPT